VVRLLAEMPDHLKALIGCAVYAGLRKLWTVSPALGGHQHEDRGTEGSVASGTPYQSSACGTIMVTRWSPRLRAHPGGLEPPTPLTPRR